MENGFAEGYAMGQGNTCNGGYSGFGWGGEWIWIIVLFALWQNGGFGFGGRGASDVANQYVLNSDVATLQRQLSDGFNGTERKLDSVTNGICDLGYAALGQSNGINTTVMRNGYETRNAIAGLGTQLQGCCCDIREGIAGVNYNMATHSNGIERQIERGFCDTNYNSQAAHAQTMVAIDKVGDRIIDYLSTTKAQELRDENQALRLAASQSAQNAYLINQLKTPCPVPAYVVPSPYCNCGNCGNNTYGYTI